MSKGLILATAAFIVIFAANLITDRTQKNDLLVKVEESFCKENQRLELYKFKVFDLKNPSDGEVVKEQFRCVPK